jgi:PAS domain S-box-containing protein
MDYQLSEIFDLSKLKELMESFHKVSGVSSGLVDLEGNILIRTGWQDVCTQFYRREPASQLICDESDRTILSGLKIASEEDKPYYVHQCINGLVYAVAPIRLRGAHLANFMFGQFFMDTPNLEEFIQRANYYGFPLQEYLAALERVPVFSLEKLDSIISHFLQFSELLGEMGLNRLELIETKKIEIKQAKSQLKYVFNSIPNIAVQIYDLQGKILYWNHASTDLYGWDRIEAIGKTPDKLIMDKKAFNEFQLILNKLEQGNDIKPHEWICKCKDGCERSVFSTVVPISVGIYREIIRLDIDTTERKHFEKELARLDRLTLVGEMAASISHEVRNPMTTVRGFLQVLSEKKDCEPYRDYYELMIQELDRANSIISEFLSLAKNRPIQLEKINLNQVIQAIIPLIEANARIFNQNVKVTTKRIPKLRLDEKEIRQLILNLIRNAMEAMDPGGHLTIETYCEGDKVVLSVGDDGPGISPAILEKLGTPFITTKPSGTGLGLPVCYSIALRHGAIIEVNTGKSGTTFFVKFQRP